jgi:hypothetical protein
LEENQGVLVDISTIYKTLHQWGFALKQNSFIASECVGENHTEYQIEVAEDYHPRQLVFINECTVNCSITRWSRRWALIRFHSCRREFFIHGT